MKIIYYDCFAGISGDMNLGALIDLGVPIDHVLKELGKLPVKGYSVTSKPDLKKGISGTRVKVNLEDEHHGHGHGHGHGHSHNHSHHRTFKNIRELINQSDLNDQIKQNSIEIFRLVAEAEGKIHNKPTDEVHFHEVGAVDSIVDIVGAAICIDYLKPDRIMCSTIELGGGFIECAHGTFPVPAPATIEILKGIPVRKGTVDKETTTPTGAAILAHFVDEFTDQVNFKIEKTAYGIGYYDFPIPNVLRVHLCTSEENLSTQDETALMLESNIDDMSPEHYGYIMDKLFQHGAHDVFLTPIIMKKSRPAIKLSVLCDSKQAEEIIQFILQETTTLGIRKYSVSKSMLTREFTEVETPWGKVQVKKAMLDGQEIKYKAEYDDCIRIANEQNIPLNDVIKAVDTAMNKNK